MNTPPKLRPPQPPKFPPPMPGPAVPDGLDPDGAWATLAQPRGRDWLIPERDAVGTITGTSVRRPDGSKIMVPGSKHGLTFGPALLSALAGGIAGTPDDPVFLVEGASDTAAGMDLGIYIVGRPSATGGGDLSAELLGGRHVAIIAENDPAGIDGANRIATRLRQAGCTVTIIRPPDGIKDLRAWKIEGGTRDDVLAALDAARSAVSHASQTALDAACQTVANAPSGGRNDALNRVSFSLGQAIIAGEVDEAEAIAKLTEAAEACGLDADEAAATIQSGIGGGKLKPRIVPASQPFHSFPLEVVPDPVRSYIAAAATALGVDVAMVAVPVLVALGAAPGLSRSGELKPGWQEFPILWAAVVAASGTTKSAALDAAFWPLRQAQSAAFETYKAAMERYETDRRSYESACRGKGTWDGSAPTPPVCERNIVSDITVEALAPILRDNPRGVVIFRDELAAFFGGFDRYAKSGRGGAEEAHYLEMFNAKAITVDRKGGDEKTIYVPRAGVFIVGSIQPGILRKVLGPQQLQDGLASRFLFVQPPTPPKKWSEAAVHPDLNARYRAVIDGLRSLAMGSDESGRPAPVPLPLSPDAKAAWIEFYNEHNAMMAGERDEANRAALAKLEAYAARFALILTLVRNRGAQTIDATSMEGGVTLARWFAGEAKRLYARFAGAVEPGTDPGLVQWMRDHGGTATASELARSGPRAFRGKPEMAAAALDGLARSGAGRWETPPPSLTAGGRPTQRLRLVSGYGYETPILAPATGGFVSTAGDGEEARS
jgi:hypothetical protein